MRRVPVLVLSGAFLVIGVVVAGVGWSMLAADEPSADAAPAGPSRSAPVPAEEPQQREHDGDTPVSQLADPRWVAERAASTGIGERALAAYAGAALRLEEEQPECGLSWNTLAGIGQVESEHGTIDGSRLRDDGRVEPAIVGIPLDGREGVRAIRDTDGGRLDGDATWDRAVGPMQFIPSSWARFAADGNGDGVEDVQNIDDAALAAARYLCAAGADLRDPAGWVAAVGSYNDSVEYAQQVSAYATRWAV